MQDELSAWGQLEGGGHRFKCIMPDKEKHTAIPKLQQMPRGPAGHALMPQARVITLPGTKLSVRQRCMYSEVWPITLLLLLST